MAGIFYRLEINGIRGGGAIDIEDAFRLLDEKLAEPDSRASWAKVIRERSGGGSFRQDTVCAMEWQRGRWVVTHGERPEPAPLNIGLRSRPSDLATGA